MEFTGERVVEGKTPRRIWLDHIARYEFASKYVRAKIFFTKNMSRKAYPSNMDKSFKLIRLFATSLNHTVLSEVL